MRENPGYLAFIRLKPCLFCGREAVPHHVRSKIFTPPKMRGGIGLKPYDVLTVPLCPGCHESVHNVRKTIENPHFLIMELMEEFIVFMQGRKE